MRALLVTLVVVALTTALMAAPAAPAAPAQPAGGSFTFEPTSFDRPSGTVQVTWSGADPTLHVGQCAATVLSSPDQNPAVHCRAIGPLGAASGTMTASVTAIFRAATGEVACGDVPGGCIVAVGRPDTTSGTVAWAPLTFSSAVGMTMAPSGPLALGQAVTVSLDGLEPGGRYRLATCLPDLASPPTCSPEALAPPLVAAADGTATATVTPRSRLDGTPTCITLGCVLAASAEDDPSILAAVSYAFADGTLTLVPDREVAPPPDGAMRADLAGLAPGRTYELRWCAPYVLAADGIVDGCAPDVLGRVTADGAGEATATVPTTWSTDSPAGGAHPCQRGNNPCAVGAILPDTDGGPRVVAVGHFTLAGATVSIRASEPLAGETVTVDVAGLRPGASYHLAPCLTSQVTWTPIPDWCDRTVAGPRFVAGPDGTASADVPIVDHVDVVTPAPQPCEPQACAVGVVDEQWFTVPGFAPYDLVRAELAADPATGLADGRVARLTGTHVRPSFDGPAWGPFPTGTWGVGQCSRALAWSPVTVADVFRHCVPAPGAGVVDVPGNDFAVDVVVRSVIDPVLGDPVDCAGPDACALAVTRIERDGTVTIHTTPIALAP